MSEGLNIESLDMPDTEILNAPEPVAESPPPSVPSEPSVPASEPVIETAERARDSVTGKFVAQAPATIVDPPKAVEPKPEPKVIPLASHLEEKNRWKQEIASRDQRLAEINDRLEKLTPKAPEPDFIEDPKGYVDAQTQKAQAEVKALREEASRLQEQQQFSQFQNTVASHEAEFIKDNADYYDAIAYVRSVRIQQFTDMYPDVSQEQIKQAIAQEELTGAYQFMLRGRNPAEGSYRLAQTYGYKKAEAPKPQAPKIEVPKAPVADPGNTLGSSGGGEGEGDDLGENPLDAFTEALKERFGARR